MKSVNSKESILAIAAGFLLFYFIYKIDLLIKISFLIMLIGIFSDFLSDKIALGWMYLGKILGFVVSKIVLGLLFFFFLTPIAIGSRLFRGNKILGKKRINGSFYIERNHEYSKQDLEQVF